MPCRAVSPEVGYAMPCRVPVTCRPRALSHSAVGGVESPELSSNHFLIQQTSQRNLLAADNRQCLEIMQRWHFSLCFCAQQAAFADERSPLRAAAVCCGNPTCLLQSPHKNALEETLPGRQRLVPSPPRRLTPGSAPSPCWVTQKAFCIPLLHTGQSSMGASSRLGLLGQGRSLRLLGSDEPGTAL